MICCRISQSAMLEVIFLAKIAVCRPPKRRFLWELTEIFCFGYIGSRLQGRTVSHQNASSVVDQVPQSNVDMTNYIVDVNQHIEKVSGGAFTTFICKLCGKEGKKSIDMQRHIETHLEGLSYSCQLCRKTFRSRNSLRTHRTQFHK